MASPKTKGQWIMDEKVLRLISLTRYGLGKVVERDEALTVSGLAFSMIPPETDNTDVTNPIIKIKKAVLWFFITSP
jgi:hypothetical protein